MTVRQPEARVVFIMISTHTVSTHIGTEIDSLTYLLVTCLTAFYVTDILCFTYTVLLLCYNNHTTNIGNHLFERIET